MDDSHAEKGDRGRVPAVGTRAEHRGSPSENVITLVFNRVPMKA